jgi:hypothetical protein
LSKGQHSSTTDWKKKAEARVADEKESKRVVGTSTMLMMMIM